MKKLVSYRNRFHQFLICLYPLLPITITAMERPLMIQPEQARAITDLRSILQYKDFSIDLANDMVAWSNDEERCAIALTLAHQNLPNYCTLSRIIIFNTKDLSIVDQVDCEDKKVESSTISFNPQNSNELFFTTSERSDKTNNLIIRNTTTKTSLCKILDDFQHIRKAVWSPDESKILLIRKSTSVYNKQFVEEYSTKTLKLIELHTIYTRNSDLCNPFYQDQVPHVIEILDRSNNRACIRNLRTLVTTHLEEGKLKTVVPTTITTSTKNVYGRDINGTVQSWDTQTGKLLLDLHPQPQGFFLEENSFTRNLYDVKVRKDHNQVVAIAHNHKSDLDEVLLTDPTPASDKDAVPSYSHYNNIGNFSSEHLLQLSPSGNYLLVKKHTPKNSVYSDDGTLHIYDVAQLQLAALAAAQQNSNN